jgi:hypothetical protein
MRQCLDVIGDAGVNGIGITSLAGRMGVGLATAGTYTNLLCAKGLIVCTGGRGSVWRLSEPRRAMAVQMVCPAASVWKFAESLGST